MSDSFFIKAAAYGGYDKTDVDKRLEFLYENIHDLKNSLRETKLLLKNYEEGNDTAKTYDAVLAAERANLSQLQVKNRTLTEKCRAAREDAQQYEAENAQLREKVAQLEAELSETKLKIPPDANDNASILSNVFMEAQKSGTMLIESAKVKADTIRSEAEKFSEEFIADANFRAQKIIYDAEKEAVDIRTAAMNETEQMRVASDNLHALMLDDVDKLYNDLSQLQTAMTKFQKSGLQQLEETSTMLYAIREKMSEGGVPVFRSPVEHVAEYPEPPQNPSKKKETTEKQNMELARLQSMAESLEGIDDDADKDSAPKQNDNSQKQDAAHSNGVSLEDLAKQVASLAGLQQ